jgi:hypothetical protein
VKFWLAALFAVWPLAGQARFAKFGRDLQDTAPGSRAAILQSGRVVWRSGKIPAAACEEPVIAERIPPVLLDTPAPIPPGATIRQVLSNTADGTPGEEVLDNLGFFDALKPLARHTPLPNAIEFAAHSHGTLGWLSQEYAGERVLWCFGPSVLIVQIPGKKIVLVASGNFSSERLEGGNVARSSIALAFFKDVAGVQGTERDEWINQAFLALSSGDRQAATTLARQALDKFPELESTPDVTLLYLFSQLGLSETEASATAVIRKHPSLPTAWFYYGQYLLNAKRYREAAVCFEKITMHQPPWHNWTVAAASKELTSLKTQGAP